MAAGATAVSLLNNILETVSENVSKKKRSFSEEGKSKSGGTQFNRPFGRQKSVHILLGGGKSADMMLWRNKKISGGVLASATAIWVLFQWLNQNFLSLVCFAVVLGMLVQFFWSIASGVLYSTPPTIPRVVLPDELFVDMAKSVGVEVNRALNFLQDIACEGNIKQFVVVVASLSAAAIIGSWCNFVTVMYIGFVASQALPVLYERYEDQVDNFVYNLLDQLQQHYRKLDDAVISKIPGGQFEGKKHE